MQKVLAFVKRPDPGDRAREKAASVRQQREGAANVRPLLRRGVVAAGLAASLLALPASDSAPGALPRPLVVEAAPERAQSGCPPQLARGSRGDNVEFLQVLLSERFGYRLATDGVFGDATHRAVRDWQRRAGLRQDGIVGPLTWSSLLAC
jgi:peptidoglycan hydrolase-like protein with peptidoglycan-binding domain